MVERIQDIRYQKASIRKEHYVTYTLAIPDSCLLIPLFYSDYTDFPSEINPLEPKSHISRMGQTEHFGFRAVQ